MYSAGVCASSRSDNCSLGRNINSRYVKVELDQDDNENVYHLLTLRGLDMYLPNRKQEP